MFLHTVSDLDLIILAYGFQFRQSIFFLACKQFLRPCKFKIVHCIRLHYLIYLITIFILLFKTYGMRL